jgi:hypothetical protein
MELMRLGNVRYLLLLFVLSIFLLACVTSLNYDPYGAEAKKQKSNIIDLSKLSKEHHQTKNDAKETGALVAPNPPGTTKNDAKETGALVAPNPPGTTKNDAKETGALVAPNPPGTTIKGNDSTSSVSQIGPVTVFTTTTTKTHTNTVGQIVITTTNVLTTTTYVYSKK